MFMTPEEAVESVRHLYLVCADRSAPFSSSGFLGIFDSRGLAIDCAEKNNGVIVRLAIFEDYRSPEGR